MRKREQDPPQPVEPVWEEAESPRTVMESRQEAQKNRQCSYSSDELFQSPTREAAVVSKLAAASRLCPS